MGKYPIMRMDSIRSSPARNSQDRHYNVFIINFLLFSINFLCGIPLVLMSSLSSFPFSYFNGMWMWSYSCGVGGKCLWRISLSLTVDILSIHLLPFFLIVGCFSGWSSCLSQSPALLNRLHTSPLCNRFHKYFRYGIVGEDFLISLLSHNSFIYFGLSCCCGSHFMFFV